MAAVLTTVSRGRASRIRRGHRSGAEIFSEIGGICRTSGDHRLQAQAPACPPRSSARDKVKEFLEKRMKEAASPEEIRVEELTLKKFGLVPQDFDLAKNTVDLLTEQAAAFYDFHKRSCSSPIGHRRRRGSRRWCTSWGMRWRTRTSTWRSSSSRAEKRRWLAGAAGGDGRASLVADGRIPGAQSGTIAGRFAGAAGDHGAQHRIRRRPVSGFRQ